MGSRGVISLILLNIVVSSLQLGESLEHGKRTSRWVVKDSALRYLTEMTVMDDFKKNILTPIMKERVSGTQGNKEVQEFIKTIMSALGWYVEEDKFHEKTPLGVKEFTNIIATLDPRKPGKIVVACHFDSKYFEAGGFIGATDSAVPCAMMIETARQLSCLLQKGPKEKSSVKDYTPQFVFLDGEEAFKTWTSTDSVYGARHLAERWGSESISEGSTASKLSEIREFILLDLIGTRDTRISNQFEDTSDVYLQLVKAEKYLRSKGLLNPEHSSQIFSEHPGWRGIEDDHIPFMARGVPIVHLISTPFPHVWHKMTDNWKNLDFDLIDNFMRIFRLFFSNLLHLQPEFQGCRKKISEKNIDLLLSACFMESSPVQYCRSFVEMNVDATQCVEVATGNNMFCPVYPK